MSENEQPPKETKEEIKKYLLENEQLPEADKDKIQQVADYMKKHVDEICDKFISLTDEELAEIIAPDWGKLIKEGKHKYPYKKMSWLLCGANPDMPNIESCFLDKRALNIKVEDIKQAVEGIDNTLIRAGIKKYIISAEFSPTTFEEFSFIAYRFYAFPFVDGCAEFDNALKHLTVECLRQWLSLQDAPVIQQVKRSIREKKISLQLKLFNAIFNGSSNCFGEETKSFKGARYLGKTELIEDEHPLKIIEVIHWLEREQHAYDGEFPYSLDPKFIKFHKKRSGEEPISFQVLKKENTDLRRARVAEEKLLAYFFLERDTELSEQKNWPEYYKNTSFKTTIKKDMAKYGLEIDDKTMNNILELACNRYILKNSK